MVSFAPFVWTMQKCVDFLCLFNLGSLHLYLSIMVYLFVPFSVFSPHSVCVCLCLHSLLCSTFECNFFSLRSASLLAYTGKVGRISRHSPYICMLWSYYLGHVLGFLMVTNWATFVFLKRLFVKKHYKNRGFSRFFSSKKRDPEIFNSY